MLKIIEIKIYGLLILSFATLLFIKILEVEKYEPFFKK
jgi:hypothetical protein